MKINSQKSEQKISERNTYQAKENFLKFKPREVLNLFNNSVKKYIYKNMNSTIENAIK